MTKYQVEWLEPSYTPEQQWRPSGIPVTLSEARVRRKSLTHAFACDGVSTQIHVVPVISKTEITS